MDVDRTIYFRARSDYIAGQHRPIGPILRERMKRDMAISAALVLATVNAPYSTQLKAHELAHCLQDQAAAKAVPGHMSSFLGEVDPALQVGFASLFGISEPQLIGAAKAFAAYSGGSYPLAA